MVRKLALVALIVVFAACSSDSSKSASSTSSTSSSSSSASSASSTSGQASAAAPADGLAIKNFQFVTAGFTGKVGQTVMVANEDGTNHSLTADDGSFDTTIFSSGSKPITFTKAGAITVHCQIHNFMTGVIQVTE